MNKPSRLVWSLVLALACAFVLVLAWQIVRKPPHYTHQTFDILGGVKSTMGMFWVDCGRYPTTAEGLQALIACPTNISQIRWKGPYFDPPNVPKDWWGHDFVYRCPGIHNTNGYDLYSMGPDGVSKSGGDDPDDIGNWLPIKRTNE